MLGSKTKLLFLSVCFLLGVFLYITDVSATSITPPPFKDKSFQGRYVSQSIKDPIEIPVGGSKEVTIKLKNIGKSTWSAAGTNFVSAYTVSPNYHASKMYGASWLGKGQPAKISQTTKPGGVAEMRIKLYAPSKVGEYTEHFYLAAENKTWIAGTYFYLKVKAVAKPAVVQDEPDNAVGNSALGAEEVVASDPNYQANLLAISARSITATGGDQIRFLVRYINTGSSTWNSYIWQEAGSVEINSSTEPTKVNVADSSWQNAKQIQGVSGLSVATSQPLEIVYYFRAPAKVGSYLARFQLLANQHALSNGTFELPITVVAPAPAGYQPPIFLSQRTLVSEPIVRIGLYKAIDPVEVQSPFDYQVYTGTNLQGTLPAQELATLSYSRGQYLLESASLTVSSSEFISLVPNDPGDYFVLNSYDRKVSWKGNKNFNIYRGTLEFKYSPKSDALYVVNALPMEEYIAGIGETSNGAPLEYIKAILVAARSYAYFHLNNGLPPDKRTFDLYATTADQLYLGYNSEVLMPRVVQAQQATYGEMVTYNAAPVVTPYFGNSNGQTKTWKEVWGGSDKPWLQSVEAFYDIGRKQLGHGVGMSARDAAERASRDGWTYDQLLKYYYTGTEVEKIY